MSEEAAEATNKYIRQFRLFFTRKNNRQNTMTDLLHRLLANSDPFVASLQHTYKKPLRTLNSSAREMLKAPSVGIEEEELDEEENNMEQEENELDCDMFFNIEDSE